ncbi:MAG: YdcF family protein [Clostridiales Family XIII bacterium]|jgi:uncharacterized SAM-binding protein YcdF (DUF218 family)|nr:YdcF family protein [Clostridiales Family XIII bacterium]
MPFIVPVWLSIGIPLLLFAVFFALYLHNRASLVPSVFLTCFLFATGILLVGNLYASNAMAAKVIASIFVIIVLVVAVFGVYALIAFLLLNARAVLKREKRSLANSLTLLFVLALIAYLVIMRIVDPESLPSPLRAGMHWAEAMVACYSFHVSQYLVATFLCNLSRPKKNQDYIIVHGAGLKDGALPPLLVGRVDRAIAFYESQKKVGTPPKLIMSGGQGKDEPRTEAEAMAEYAMCKGVPEADILLEAESTNTMQNMKFSKRIMDIDSEGQPYLAIYATSNYHLLRTGIYARKAGLRISGIGAKTAPYYLPVALLREYIAYIAMHRKRNIAFALVVFLLSCAVVYVSQYTT